MPMSDWRSPAAYAHARSISAAGFAWEYLRRDHDYRRAFYKISGFAGNDIGARTAFSERWGLRFPGRPGSARRPRIDILVARAAA
jgi:hypothetical protein